MKNALSWRLMGALLCLALTASLSRPPSKVDEKVTLEVVPNPMVIRVLGRSHLDFIADLFWVRMANMAGRANTVSECAALLPIGNLIADLAPKFRYPYFVGGVLAPVRLRDGRYENVEGAMALMERGVKEVPDYLRLHIQKAYTELDILKDKEAAGRTLQAAAKIPDAPPFVGKLATRLLTEAGKYDDAREFAAAMANSEDPQLRADFEHRLKMIDLEQVLVKVEQAATRFFETHKRPAANVAELVALGFLPSFPQDPFGGEIVLTDEGPRSTVESRRLRAYVPAGME